MKLKIELDDTLNDDEIIIKVRRLSKTIEDIENIVRQETLSKQSLSLFKDNVEFFIPIYEILFFETQGDFVYAHTADDSYKIKQRLNELCTILPDEFVRISKSAVLNANHILSIDRSITSSSLVKFRNSHKKVYVSRLYYKVLKEKLWK